ncbi:MAG: threonine--tRNA ligase, partial [Pseudanabaena sp.]
MDAVAEKPSESKPSDIKPSDILRQADTEKLARIRHTCSHVMAMAVQKLYPDAKVTIGPATENGFYYDFDRSEHFTPSDLKA